MLLRYRREVSSVRCDQLFEFFGGAEKGIELIGRRRRIGVCSQRFIALAQGCDNPRFLEQQDIGGAAREQSPP